MKFDRLRIKRLICLSLAAILAAPAADAVAAEAPAANAGQGAAVEEAAPGGDSDGALSGVAIEAVGDLARDKSDGYRYFYDQLSREAKPFYGAMREMYELGIFKTGNGEYDLVANQVVTQDQLAAFAGGDKRLLQEMGAARDAFCADYPDIFYVDFSYLSIRVTRDGSGAYHAALGPGRGEDYYTQGFESEGQVEAAISRYEDALGEIVEKARDASPRAGEDADAARARAVHDAITRGASYRLEDSCAPGNVGFIRTAYGPIVRGEGVCEGYARAYKSALDRLGIPCVLVQGVYRRTEDASELHMWNEARIGGSWYAVDATMDDPISKHSNSGIDGYENDEYLLVGRDVMSRRHVSSGVMSEAEFEFSYPGLSELSIDFERVSDPGSLLKVDYSANGTFENERSGIFRVSYNGMGYRKAIEREGIYILARQYIYYDKTDEWIIGDWGYPDPEVYNSIKDEDDCMTFYMPQCQYAEFAVTDRAPGDFLSDPSRLTYQGDPMLLDEGTGMLYNESSGYVAPPYIKTITPSATGRILIGDTYHVVATYDDNLELRDGAATPGYSVSVDDPNSTGADYCKIENFEWDGAATISFDFTPSNMWADDSVSYVIDIKGLVGRRSGKTPNPITYFASYPCAVCAYRSSGYDWNVFGKPALMENANVSTEGWKIEDGGEVSEDMLSRLVLVATSTTNGDADAMNDLIGKADPGESVLKSETYNISLSICNRQVIKTGDAVRVSVGFPKGYGPDDAGVTFKAYHFTRDDTGAIVSVEEIPCIITEYGLVVLCDSFSPFAIVAVEGGTENDSVEKSVLLSASAGGRIESSRGSAFSLRPGEEAPITVLADGGYVIDRVLAGGASPEARGQSSATFSVRYEDLPLDSNIIDAQFIAESVLEKEEERGESPVLPSANPVKITFDSETVHAKIGQPFQIVPTIEEFGGVQAYQWYKDGEALEGQGEKTLRVESARAEDAGVYTLVVTTTVGAASAMATSPAVTVVVGGENIPSEDDLSITGLSATSPAAGKVSLKWKKNESADGYLVYRYDGGKGEFVKVADTVSASFTDKKRGAGVPCRYKVRAYEGAGDDVSYGRESGVAKVLTRPKAPGKIRATRVSPTQADISFNAAAGADAYWLYRYDAKSREYAPSYRVKGKKLYRYDAARGKWIKAGAARQSAGGRITVRVTDLKAGKAYQYKVRSLATESGYAAAESAGDKVLTVQARVQ